VTTLIFTMDYVVSGWFVILFLVLILVLVLVLGSSFGFGFGFGSGFLFWFWFGACSAGFMVSGFQDFSVLHTLGADVRHSTAIC
jgi:hypothetical protein